MPRLSQAEPDDSAPSDTSKLLPAQPNRLRTAASSTLVERSSSWVAPSPGGAQPVEEDDGRQRKQCYIRVQLSVTSVDLLSHAFDVRGHMDLFWREADEFATNLAEEHSIEVPTGSVDDGVYQAVLELPDNGSSSMPINPDNLFVNQLALRHTAKPKLLFDAERGIVHYTLYFDATLSCVFALHDFPFDRQILPVQLSFRSGSFALSPTAFEGVPGKWGLRTPASVAMGPVSQVSAHLSGCIRPKFQRFVWAGRLG